MQRRQHRPEKDASVCVSVFLIQIDHLSVCYSEMGRLDLKYWSIGGHAPPTLWPGLRRSLFAATRLFDRSSNRILQVCLILSKTEDLGYSDLKRADFKLIAALCNHILLWFPLFGLFLCVFFGCLCVRDRGRGMCVSMLCPCVKPAFAPCLLLSDASSLLFITPLVLHIVCLYYHGL